METRETKLLKPREVAQKLAVSSAQIYKLANLGVLPHVRIGRSVRFNAEVIDKVMRKGTGCGTPINVYH